MQEATWLQIAPFTLYDWMTDPLRREAERWNAELKRLVARRRAVDDRREQLETESPDFVEQAEQLRRAHLECLAAAVSLLKQAVPLAGNLEAAWREAKEAARQAQSEADAEVRRKLEAAGFDLSFYRDHAASEVMLTVDRMVALHPLARTATDVFLEVAESRVYPGRAEMSRLLDTARREIRNATACLVGIG